MANNDWGTVPTKAQKKQAVTEKRSAKTEALTDISADIEKQLQEVTSAVEYIEKHNYMKYEIRKVFDSIVAAAANAKKTTNVGIAKAKLETILGGKKTILEAVAALGPRVALEAQKKAKKNAEEAVERERIRFSTQIQMDRKEWQLERLYTFLYFLYNMYKKQTNRISLEDRAYIASHSAKLAINISPLTEATSQNQIDEYLTKLYKDLNKLYKKLLAEKTAILPNPNGRKVTLSSSLQKSKQNVDDIIKTIKEAEEGRSNAAEEERNGYERAAEETRRAEEARREVRPLVVPNQNAYNILGIEQGVNNSVIKAAYKKLALKHHPDKGGNEEKFKRIQNAYERLTRKKGGSKRLRKTMRK